MAKQASFVIQTRQKADLLFSITRPLGAAASLTSEPRRVQGYGAINFLGISDAAFTITVEEATDPAGPWAVTLSQASAADANSNQVVCLQLSPCGTFMRVTVTAGGADQGELSFTMIGLPVAGGGGGGGGGGTAVPNQPTFAVNQKTVAAPGTAEQLQSQAVPNGFSIFVRALLNNTGTIWVGPDKATAEDHSKATPLEPGAFLELYLTNVEAIWIDAEVADEGVSWTVEVA